MITRYKAKRIDIIFDRYFSSSIKEIERSRRDEFSTTEYIIAGPDQARGVEFSREMSNIKFKEALVKFLSMHWSSTEATPFIGNKIINLNFDLCYRFEVINGEVVKTTDDQLICEGHEEADTKIVYHICKLDTGSRILIKANDTDILIIMLGNMKHIKSETHIWMQCGTGNNIRDIDITTLYSILGESVSQALPGLHAFTGCDYNPAFFRKGKNRPFKLLLTSDEYQRAFIQLGTLMSSSERSAVFQTLERFVCHMYSVEHERTQTTSTEVALYQHFMAICTHAISHEFTSGWTWLDSVQNKDLLDFCWFEGEQLPQLISDVIITEGIEDELVDDPTKEIEDDKEIHRDSDGDEDDEEDEIINADESSDF
ncbi:unnamed protein product [Ceutorhynchus assimilis]|uniref:Uncharacterized protein n=1 Tax=Ceutorhynchus assimilis TaxID=467358 RepID=A0A9N9MQF3_9CUCU|nr:unnamed protein product [Ceutorhynchus assimilis]